ncbi:MAG: hypothetical protein ACKO2L_22520 [Planctomycetaceae bacterium]
MYHPVAIAILITMFLPFGVSLRAADEPVYSGPQPGEALPQFSFRQVLSGPAGELLDPVRKAAGRPLVLIFIHDVNRQSIGFARVLSGYTHGRRSEGLSTAVVLLEDDASAGEAQLRRISHALTSEVPTGVSVDGREGPGSLGLNRNVTLTILVAHKNQVTASFAFVQPSLQADLPLVLKAVVDVAGGTVPDLEQLQGVPQKGRMVEQPGSVPNLRPLLTPLIRRDASVEDVDRAAKEIEDKAAADAAVKKELARIARTIVDSGKLENYGTKKAQEHLSRWAREFNKPESPQEPRR